MVDQSEPALPHAVALAWGVAANPQRGPRRELSVERIVETAIAVADAEGLGAVSMARIAQELGYTTMSLYRYVTAKDDLLQLMQDEVAGFEMPGAGGEDWRAELRAWAQLTMAQLAKHPWFVDVPVTGIPLMPNQLRVLEAGLTALGSTPLSGPEKMATVLVVANHARESRLISAQIAAAGGSGSEAARAALAATLRELLDPAEYPQVTALLDAGALTDPDFDDAGYGLERILDGVAAHIAGGGDIAGGAAGAGGAASAGAGAATAGLDPDLAPYANDPKVKEAARARREAEKALREAQKRELETLKNARERAKNAAERAARRA